MRLHARRGCTRLCVDDSVLTACHGLFRRCVGEGAVIAQEQLREICDRARMVKKDMHHAKRGMLILVDCGEGVRYRAIFNTGADGWRRLHAVSNSKRS